MGRENERHAVAVALASAASVAKRQRHFDVDEASGQMRSAVLNARALNSPQIADVKNELKAGHRVPALALSIHSKHVQD